MKSRPSNLSLWAKPHVLYMAVAFGFSWLIWILAWFVARGSDAGDILFNADLLWKPFAENNVSRDILLLSILSSVGVYGPLLGAYVASKKDASTSWGKIWRSSTRFDSTTIKYIPTVLAILFAVVIVPSIVTIIASKPADNAPSILGGIALLFVFFVTQILTSGTEEIGWRGYLTDKLLPSRGFWDAGWAVGIVWAVWHFPVVTMMFIQQGMVHVQIIGSLAGFTMGIIAMAIVHSWFYEKTGRASLNILIHALFNAIPLVLAVSYTQSPVALVSNLLLWLVVIYLKRRSDTAGSRTPDNA